ncbi:MAG: hypothetical protein KKC14_11550 [Alphaproteobacteria bacterium]|nr:hypothetical protein [Alphaproteobacteria bacterium]
MRKTMIVLMERPSAM